MFDEYTVQASFTGIEEEVKRFWRRHEVPAAARAARREGCRYILYQQPLTVVGQPRADQVRLLATADLSARYHTMRGDAVYHQAGWACHGLPIEVALERSLGPTVAEYDLEQFNAACREAVMDGLQRGEKLAEHLGVWLQPANTYATLTPRAIGAVWGALRRLWDAGRLRQEHRITPVCPRCATPLSMVEASRCAVAAEARSVWVCLPWDGEPHTYFLAWTPIPWTLVGLVALAAHPDANYALIERPGETHVSATRLLVAEAALDHKSLGGWRLVRMMRGKSLRGARYRPPFTFLPTSNEVDRLILSKEVRIHEGTGLQPVTPAFDAPSLTLARSYDLPVPELLDDWGNLADSVTHWRGLSPLEAEPLLVEDLQGRELLFREEMGTRPRALCPHCETALLPQARTVWLAEMENGPWILGRDRAWGAPLPIWVCTECAQELCVAGLDDLAHRVGVEVDQIEPHRPSVDRLLFACETCGGMMRHSGAVVDADFESAVLPLSMAPQPGPADLAVGLDDGRHGWLDDLVEMAALLQESPAWHQAAAVSECRAEETWTADRMPPGDALRWAAYTHTTLDQAEEEFLRPLWQRFVELTDRKGQTAPSRQAAGQDTFDRWWMARVQETILAVSEALEACRPQRATGCLAALVDDWVDWYEPNRPGGGGATLETLSRLLAPFVPHLAEATHRRLGIRTIDTVHLTDWPAADPAQVDPEIVAAMAQMRHLAALGQMARSQAGIEPDRPLHQALVSPPANDLQALAASGRFQDLLASLLGVARVHFTPEAEEQVTWCLAYDSEQVPAHKTAPAIEAALASLAAKDAAELASQLRQGLTTSLLVDGQAITLLPNEVKILVQARPNWTAAADAEILVVLEVG